MAERASGKIMFIASGSNPLIHPRAVTASLEALRHPKSEFRGSL
jgi:hypothetical protein